MKKRRTPTPRINLRRGPKRALAALVRMEGADWLRRQRAGQFKGYSVFDAQKELGKRLNGFHRLAPTMSVAVIYGAGGWNRYGVRANGDVYFIRLQSRSKADTTKARRLGFEIW